MTLQGTALAPRRIVLSGTFDVRNYGDLLFPLLAAHRLHPHGLQVIAASPTARDTGWRDAMPPVALAQALAPDAPALGPSVHGLLIGGGNILHGRPVTLADYVAAGAADRAYPDLWLGASQWAARRGIPVAWNAPGVPFAPSEVERPAVQAALATAAYLSVRDKASADFLGLEAGHIVPDTALGLADLWPRAALEADFRALLQRLSPGQPGPYLAVHVKERALDLPLSALAAQLVQFRAATGRTPILIGIGACHGDDLVTAALAALMPGQCLDLSRPLGLREIAAAIALSDGYVGASMHGYVTAAAYDRPGIILGRPRLPKMQGLLSQLGRVQDEVTAWTPALDQMRHRIDQPRPVLPPRVAQSLSAHWQAVARALTQPSAVQVLATQGH